MSLTINFLFILICGRIYFLIQSIVCYFLLDVFGVVNLVFTKGGSVRARASILYWFTILKELVFNLWSFLEFFLNLNNCGLEK